MLSTFTAKIKQFLPSVFKCLYLTSLRLTWLKKCTWSAIVFLLSFLVNKYSYLWSIIYQNYVQNHSEDCYKYCVLLCQQAVDRQIYIHKLSRLTHTISSQSHSLNSNKWKTFLYHSPEQSVDGKMS